MLPASAPLLPLIWGPLGGDSGSLAVTTSPGDPGPAQTEGGRVTWARQGLPACLLARDETRTRAVLEDGAGPGGGGTLSAPACSVSSQNV